MIQLTEPVFLNVEFSHSFVKEYPVCATEKNIVMPYPSTDPEMLTAQMMYALPPSIESLTSNIEGNRGQSHLVSRIRIPSSMCSRSWIAV